MRPLQDRNTDRAVKASCIARPHHTLGSKRAGRIRSSLSIEPEAFLRAKQSNPSPVQIPLGDGAGATLARLSYVEPRVITVVGSAKALPKIRFAIDSPLEQAGFELTVPP
jgi:hypothetical protein